MIPAVAPRYGGPSRAIFGMCRALQGQEVEPVIVTTDADGAGRLPVELGKPVTYSGVPAHFFPRQLSEAFKYSPPLARWIKANVTAFDVAHIHAVYSHSSLAAARACRRQGVPYVVRPLGSLDPWSLRQKRLQKRLLWHLGVGRMLRNAAAVHYTTSEEQRLAEQGLGVERGVVVPLGVDEDLLEGPADDAFFRQSHPALGDSPYALVLSRLHPKKGLELLIQAFLDVTRRDGLQRWRLVVAGEGEDEYVARLKRLAESTGRDGEVLFTGWLDGDQRAAALREAALLALPSLQENFALSVAEALACGVPVLVSENVNLASEIRAAGAGWVSSLELQALSQALADALSDEAERGRRGAAGREFARRFKWPAIARELVRLYRTISVATHEGEQRRSRIGTQRSG